MRGPDRRAVMIGLASACLPAAATPVPVPDWSDLRRRLAGGRIGVAAIDLASGRRLSHLADARFPLCSTFKLPLAAAVLSRAAAGRLSRDRRVTITSADVLPHSPVVAEHLASGEATVDDLCRAVMVFSDNGAANLLLALIGGPAGLTRWLRTEHDAVTRLDHRETNLNIAATTDPADTTTPAAMLALTRRLLLGPALPVADRERLIGWMTQNETGAARLRAGLPAGWRAGSRTGTDEGVVGDVIIAWPPAARQPVLAACYVDAPGIGNAVLQSVQAEIGRTVAALAG